MPHRRAAPRLHRRRPHCHRLSPGSRSPSLRASRSPSRRLALDRSQPHEALPSPTPTLPLCSSPPMPIPASTPPSSSGFLPCHRPASRRRSAASIQSSWLSPLRRAQPSLERAPLLHRLCV
ncbi:Os07g0276050 [Oryza sativa Japonica Group]|uniref:Os07g0276050 protein n=1 Tax=Oryza sativa subsp. japonica TaxID=39947 RepID=A0A0P0X562_ORYSJ|nr:hypothetical protein EE612_038469 [Oryza sativa]BAT00971.1 Os07g0276050 [Oryza sativa Japonica Group]